MSDTPQDPTTATVTQLPGPEEPAEPDAPHIPEGLELQRSGTIRITYDDGSSVRLRRPKVGEYRRLRTELQDSQDELQEALESVADETVQARSTAVVHLVAAAGQLVQSIDDDDDDDDDDGVGAVGELREALATYETAVGDRGAADRQELRRRQREASRAAEDARLAWLRGVIAALGDREAPEPDDCPLWFTHQQTVNAVILHWQSVPPPRGGR